MITVGQRKKMKKTFKQGYMRDVQNILIRKNITNKKGETHSCSYISNVFNGICSDLKIEEALIELYTTTREELVKIRVERKKIFDTKKPEAATSGRI